MNTLNLPELSSLESASMLLPDTAKCVTDLFTGLSELRTENLPMLGGLPELQIATMQIAESRTGAEADREQTPASQKEVQA